MNCNQSLKKKKHIEKVDIYVITINLICDNLFIAQIITKASTR